MGWSAIPLWRQISQKLGLGALLLIAGGGMAYCVGIIFFIIEKPNPIPGIFCSHEIWHIFVLLGAYLHFFAHFKYTLYYNSY